MLPFAQEIGKAIQDGVNLPVPHYSAFGAIKGRRRDEALGIQMINMYKAKTNSFSCVTDLFAVKMRSTVSSTVERLMNITVNFWPTTILRNYRYIARNMTMNITANLLSTIWARFCWRLFNGSQRGLWSTTWVILCDRSV